MVENCQYWLIMVSNWEREPPTICRGLSLLVGDRTVPSRQEHLFWYTSDCRPTKSAHLNQQCERSVCDRLSQGLRGTRKYRRILGMLVNQLFAIPSRCFRAYDDSGRESMVGVCWSHCRWKKYSKHNQYKPNRYPWLSIVITTTGGEVTATSSVTTLRVATFLDWSEPPNKQSPSTSITKNNQQHSITMLVIAINDHN